MTTRVTFWLLMAGILAGPLAPFARGQNITAIERQLSLLCDNSQRLAAEINSHYRQMPQFGNLSSESARIVALANQVRGCIQIGDITQATRDLCEVERLARQMQKELDGVDQFSAQQRLPRAYRVHTRPAFRSAQFVEDYAEDLKDDIRDLPRRPINANSIAPAYPSNLLLPGSTYRVPPILENPRPPSYNYPPLYPPLRVPGQSPAPGPDPTAPAELLPEPRGVPLQAPENSNPPASDRET